MPGTLFFMCGIKGVEDDARQLARRILATRCVGWAFARS
jgi:hypothetical protein